VKSPPAGSGAGGGGAPTDSDADGSIGGITESKRGAPGPFCGRLGAEGMDCDGGGGAASFPKMFVKLPAAG
jgi:hypothetical protein